MNVRIVDILDEHKVIVEVESNIFIAEWVEINCDLIRLSNINL